MTLGARRSEAPDERRGRTISRYRHRMDGTVKQPTEPFGADGWFRPRADGWFARYQSLKQRKGDIPARPARVTRPGNGLMQPAPTN